MPKNQSVLTPELVGVIHVSGQRGIGKTLFALGVENPSNIAFLDYEEKGAGYDGQLHVGIYHSLTAEAAMDKAVATPADIFRATRHAIENLPDGLTVVIMDNISVYEQACASEVGANPKAYGVRADNAASGAFGGVNPGIGFLISGHLAQMRRKGIKLFVVTSHVKPPWIGGKPAPNKFRPKGNDRWWELSILSIILTPGDFFPAPRGIVAKEQLSQVQWTQDGLQIQRRLPPVLPKADWQTIRNLLQNPPIDFKHLPSEMKLTQDDLDVYGERLSREQVQFMLEMESAGDILNENAVAPATRTIDDREISLNEITRFTGKTLPDLMKLCGVTTLGDFAPDNIVKEMHVAKIKTELKL